MGVLVQVLPAGDAQSRAVVAAEHLARQIQSQGIARPRAQVQVGAVDVGRLEVLPASRLVDLARVHRDRARGRLEAAHARALERRLEAQPERPAGRRAVDVEPSRDASARDAVALAGKRQVIHADVELDPATLARGELQPTEIEAFGRPTHTPQGSFGA